jgi:hypothetical protein
MSTLEKSWQVILRNDRCGVLDNDGRANCASDRILPKISHLARR